MALTKIEFWLIAIGLTLVLSLSLLFFGRELQNSSTANLDSDSAQYLSDYTSHLGDSGLNETINQDIEERDVSNPILSKLGNIPIVSDFLGAFSFIANIISGIWDFFVLVFNLPSFIVSTLGIPVLKVKFIINTIGYVLLLAGIITIVRLSK